ncbi:MAG TPA: HD domain-containing protein, partial [Candidatus Binatia bacterium]|nr:HD domain-containing protein [Candidatus Binatia bacterium]
MTPTDPADPDIAAAIPRQVLAILDQLREAGHAAYVVGGSLRDVILDRPAVDWDLATDARPDRIQALFPGALYENAFGTVTVRAGDGSNVQVTTFRSDIAYNDFRRPERVEFGTSVEEDLARRDFTCNAIAWGWPVGGADGEPTLIDPFGGRLDVSRRILRAVGDPTARFAEDALRMLRAVRFAAVLGFTIEPATVDAIRRQASLAGHLSGERISAEFDRLLAADQPSVGLRLAMDTGLLAVVAPLLALQPGVAQNKAPGEDLWDHTLRSVDAAAVADRSSIVRLAALLHDIGKPATAADGHFYRHETVGADLAADLLRGWHAQRETIDRVCRLIRHHMFSYDGAWSDAAIRRFIAKVGPASLDDLFALREADNVGSGVPADAGGLSELRSRIADQLAADVALDRSGLAIDGDGLLTELGLEPGPIVGRVLEELVDRVIADPSLNERGRLLVLARGIAERSATPSRDGQR